jgi:hypothetical protein
MRFGLAAECTLLRGVKILEAAMVAASGQDLRNGGQVEQSVQAIGGKAIVMVHPIGSKVVTRPDFHSRVRQTSRRVRRSHGCPPWRLSTSGQQGHRPPQPTDRGGRPPSDCRKGWPSVGRQGRRTEADGCPVRRRPSAIAVRRKPSIWGRPPVPSALYDSNFSFLHYVFASLIAVT